MSRIYLSYDPEQKLLLPPDLRGWLPEGHLALFISDVVDELDLRGIVGHYESGDGRRRPPYHPLMMVKLLVYGYCVARCRRGSWNRRLMRTLGFGSWRAISIRITTASRTFRQLHLVELARQFVQVLKMCERSGLVKLG